MVNEVGVSKKRRITKKANVMFGTTIILEDVVTGEQSLKTGRSWTVFFWLQGSVPKYLVDKKKLIEFVISIVIFSDFSDFCRGHVDF